MIEAGNITVEINSKKLLDDVSLEMRAGEVLIVVGANGAGKSTLRKVLCGDLKQTSGTVLMNGKSLDDWTLPERAKIRAVSKSPRTSSSPDFFAGSPGDAIRISWISRRGSKPVVLTNC